MMMKNCSENLTIEEAVKLHSDGYAVICEDGKASRLEEDVK